jgi:hypothetical protein
VYFNGVPVRIEALANNEYNFLHWGNNGLISDTLNPLFLDVLNTDAIVFEAYFEDMGVSVPALDDSKSISVFPNPAQDIIYVKNDEKPFGSLHYQVIDMHGKMMLEGQLTGGNSIQSVSINSIPPSVYLLKLTDSAGQKHQCRFVKVID